MFQSPNIIPIKAIMHYCINRTPRDSCCLGSRILIEVSHNHIYLLWVTNIKCHIYLLWVTNIKCHIYLLWVANIKCHIYLLWVADIKCHNEHTMIITLKCQWLSTYYHLCQHYRFCFFLSNIATWTLQLAYICNLLSIILNCI